MIRCNRLLLPKQHQSQGNILHANELARRYADRGLVAISLHPGFVKSDLLRDHSFGATLFVQIASRLSVSGTFQLRRDLYGRGLTDFSLPK